MVSHAGTLNSGHYVAFSRELRDPATAEPPGWRYFSDTTVRAALADAPSPARRGADARGAVRA